MSLVKIGVYIPTNMGTWRAKVDTSRWNSSSPT
jgi:hypothetical protein